MRMACVVMVTAANNIGESINKFDIKLLSSAIGCCMGSTYKQVGNNQLTLLFLLHFYQYAQISGYAL